MMALPVVNTYPRSNYTYDLKDPKIRKDASHIDHRNRMKAKISLPEMVSSLVHIRSDDAHEHNHPHILLLKLINNFYKLPSGRLKPGKNEIEGLERKLSNKLEAPGLEPDWQECKKLFLVHLSEREYF